MISRGRNIPTTQTIYRLMFERHKKKVYPVFPMSHVMDLPDTLAEIDQFKATINEHFIAFDPADVDEFVLHTTAHEGVRPRARTTIEVQAADGPVTLKTAEVAQISGDIMGQIYMRDFKMVDQCRHDRQLRPASSPTASRACPAASSASCTTRSRAAKKSTSSGPAGHAQPVHHRDRHQGLQEHRRGDRLFPAEGIREVVDPLAESYRKPAPLDFIAKCIVP